MAEILKGLGVPAAVEQEHLGFENTLRQLREPTSVGDMAATTYKRMIIFIDDAYNIDIGAIPPFTALYPTEVLQIENSATTDTGGFSFWKEGQLIRNISYGLEKWMNEVGITDNEIMSHFESVDIGTPWNSKKNPAIQ